MLFSKNNKKAFGGVVSTLIMFIAIVIVTTGIVISFMGYVDKAEDSVTIKNDFLQKKLETEIEIINVVYDDQSNDVNIFIRNLGKTKLITKHFSVFLDGEFIKNAEVKKADDKVTNIELFDIQEIGIIIINKNLDGGSHNVKIVTEFGVGDEDDFNI